MVPDRKNNPPSRIAPFVVFGGILLIAVCGVTVALVGYFRNGGEFSSPAPAQQVAPAAPIYKDTVGN